jgi:hypothetical protein
MLLATGREDTRVKVAMKDRILTVGGMLCPQTRTGQPSKLDGDCICVIITFASNASGVLSGGLLVQRVRNGETSNLNKWVSRGRPDVKRFDAVAGRQAMSRSGATLISCCRVVKLDE